LNSSKEKTIIDENQIRKILFFVDGLNKSDYSGAPLTGGDIINVYVTRNGKTEQYAFIDYEVNGHILAKNFQDPNTRSTWYFAEIASYKYLLNLL